MGMKYKCLRYKAKNAKIKFFITHFNVKKACSQ